MDMRQYSCFSMKFRFLQKDQNEITPAMSFKRTCALNAISNESALTHFTLGKYWSHENLTSLWVNIGHTKISCRFGISFRSK